MKLSRFLSALGVAVFLTGCANMSLNYKNAPSGIEDTWKRDWSRNERRLSSYIIGMERLLRNTKNQAWGLSLHFYGNAKPTAYVWLDGTGLKRVGVVPENGGELIVGDRINLEIAKHPTKDSAYGRIRITLYEVDDSIVLVREVSVHMIPEPGGCEVLRKDPWIVGDGDMLIGEKTTYSCGGDVRTIIFQAKENALLMDVFRFWGHKGGKKFAALTLENGERVVTEVYDTLPYFTHDRERNVLTLQLYADKVLHTREIKLTE